MIDSHCHLDFEVFDAHRPALLQQCADDGVAGVLIPGIEPNQWSRLRLLQTENQSPCQLWLALGVHPWWQHQVTMAKSEFQSHLSDQLERCAAVAVGECGLDGSIDASIESQLPILQWQVELACERQLPLVLHGHRAHNPLLQLLSRSKPKAGGVIHGFSGSYELAQQYWRLGFYIGVGGTITYERAAKTRAAVARMPLESLVLETDAPDMPLQGFQGQPNSPLRLAQVAETLAELKNTSVDDIRQATEQNTRRLFHLNGL